MIAVIFEEWPQDEHYQRHLDLAAELKPQLEELDGFISVERYQSLTEPRKILSLSFWRDENAVKEWRSHLRRPWPTSAWRAALHTCRPQIR